MATKGTKEKPTNLDDKSSHVQDPTYTEQEVQAVANFVNFVFKRAKFDGLSSAEARQLTIYFNDMHNHVSKIEQYIFEIKKIIKGPK